MGEGASTIALYAAAIVALIWILTPAIAFSRAHIARLAQRLLRSLPT
jgi:hypothetical protein